MKRKQITLIIVIIITIIWGVSWLIVSHHKSTNKSDYYYTINSLIRDCNFNTAKIEDEQIVLYDTEGEQIGAVDFKESCDSKNPIYIRKSGNNLFFVESIAVDDEIGIFFVNDDSNGFLDGIWSIKRIGGNYYKYSTSK